MANVVLVAEPAGPTAQRRCHFCRREDV